MLRRAPVGVEAGPGRHGGGRARLPDHGQERDPAVTVIGSPAELTMWVMGRTTAARVRFDGTEAAVSKLAAA